MKFAKPQDLFPLFKLLVGSSILTLVGPYIAPFILTLAISFVFYCILQFCVWFWRCSENKTWKTSFFRPLKSSGLPAEFFLTGVTISIACVFSAILGAAVCLYFFDGDTKLLDFFTLTSAFESCSEIALSIRNHIFRF